MLVESQVKPRDSSWFPLSIPNERCFVSCFRNRGFHHTVLAGCTEPAQPDILQCLCFDFRGGLDIVRHAVAQLVLETKSRREGFALTVDKDGMACGTCNVNRIANMRDGQWLENNARSPEFVSANQLRISDLFLRQIEPEVSTVNSVLTQVQGRNDSGF